MARLLVEIEEELKRDLKVRLMREGETLKEWITRMAAAYVEGEIPSAYIAEKARALREPQTGKTFDPPRLVEPPRTAPQPRPEPRRAATPAPKKDDIFFFD